MRLNKYLALCGLGSRRAVEQLITEGQVEIGGRTVSDLATQVDESQDTVTVQGHAVRPVERRNFEYIILNKPRGYDVTRGGRHHHRRAWDLLPKDTHPSVQSVGRLDRDSTGLLLFTNDGELAFRLTHPRFGCRKVYDVEVEGDPSMETLARLTQEVMLDDGPAHAVSVERIPSPPSEPVRLRIIMEEGRNRIVRRLCEAVGHPVVSLDRIVFGPLHLNNLSRGKTRALTPREIGALRREVELTGESRETRSPGEAARRTQGKSQQAPSRQQRPQEQKGRSGPRGPFKPQGQKNERFRRQG
jgi:23S rRNA pseudouridine2605 synthase